MVTETDTEDVSTADIKRIPVRGARKITAQRMRASLQETAQVTLTRYADGTALIDFARELKSQGTTQGSTHPTINDLVLFCVSRALGQHREINATFGPDGIEQHGSVNLGFAVDTGKALLVPVIRKSDHLTLTELAGQSHELARRAREGQLTMDEMSGGTFTVSNLGSLGIHWFTPVLNAPEVGILGVGAAHRFHPEGPALLPLSLTFDHQALDGAAAATALASIVDAVHNVRKLARNVVRDPSRASG